MLLPASTGADADRITTAVRRSTSSPPVTVSIGIADLSCNARLASRSADRALYLTKQSGGNTIARLDLGRAMRVALSRLRALPRSERPSDRGIQIPVLDSGARAGDGSRRSKAQPRSGSSQIRSEVSSL